MSDNRQQGYGQQPSSNCPPMGYPSVNMPNPGDMPPLPTSSMPPPIPSSPGTSPAGPPRVPSPTPGSPGLPTLPNAPAHMPAGSSSPRDGHLQSYPTVASLSGYPAPPPGSNIPQQGYGPPSPQQGYGPPSPHQGYAAPPPQQGYGPPSSYQGYGAPSSYQGYGPPPSQQGNGAPPPVGPAAHGAAPPAHVPGGVPVAGSPQGAFPGVMSRPTVTAVSPFDPVADARALRKAMKGFGTNERALISILAFRTNQQRQEIANAFSRTLGRNLMSDIKSETSGNFEAVLLGMLHPLAVYDAINLYQAMEGLGTNEKVLTEILASRTNMELRSIKDAYKRMYNRTLEQDVQGDTSGDYRQMLLQLLTASRDEGPVNPKQAALDAKELYKAGEGRWGTTESVFATILGTRSYTHLQAVFQEYSKISKKDMPAVIRSEFSGDARDLYLAVVECATNRPAFFARSMYEAMEGFGTADSTLIRLVITRSETDLADIKDAYHKLYGRSLASAISSETSGDYKRALLALLREAY